MTRQLYECIAIYRKHLDSCLELAEALSSLRLRSILFPSPENIGAAESLLQETSFVQPALYVIEYALAMMLMDIGIEPVGMLGHSVGEYVAASLAGVFSFDTGFEIVVKRGQLVQALSRGSMLAVAASTEEACMHLSDRIALASINSSRQCVLSGYPHAIECLAEKLKAMGVASRLLRVNRAFHSMMLDPILRQFEEFVGTKKLEKPCRLFVSCVDGRWANPEEVCQATYWVRQMREPVRFSEGLGELARCSQPIFLEV